MTQIKAMEQAKAALKELVAQIEGRFFSIKHDHFAMEDARAAIRRLDEEISKLEKEYPFGVYSAEDLNRAWKSGYDNCKAQSSWTLEDVKKAWKSGYSAALEKAEQERVEWGVDWGPDGNSVSIIKRLAGGGIEVVGWEYAPHSPQRPVAQPHKWVGLTDEEANELVEHTECEDYYGLLEAVEAKLKEKNTND